jgi:gamma-glutamyltranspeptidase/glutathione hydrolase
VTIPGAVAGWAALSQRFGALPFSDLFAPAICYARWLRGPPIVAQKWALAAKVLPHELGFAEHFLHRVAPACRRALPLRADGANAGAHRGNARQRFYRGELAARWSRTPTHGALHTLDDFAAQHTRPGDAARRRLCRRDGARDPPNGQGIAALMALGILRAFDLKSLPPDSIESQHLQIEA